MECGGTIYSSNFMNRVWYETFSASSTPCAIMVEEKGDLLGIAPLTRYKYRVAKLPIKVLSLAGDMRNRLRLTTNSILYRPDRPDALEAIIDQMKRLNWSVLWTINMESSTEAARYMDLVRTTWREVEYGAKKNLEVPLPPSGPLADSYTKDGRRNFRKLMNRLERESMNVSLVKLGMDDLDRAVDTYARQHIERWENKGGSYFRNPENVEFLRSASKEAHARGKGFAYEITLNGEVAAQIFGLIEGTTAYGERIGMDNRFMRYSPGWLISNSAHTDLRDRGAEVCVMGLGGERYKYEMGAKERDLVGIGATRGIMSLMSRVALSPRMKGIESRLGIMSGTAYTGTNRSAEAASDQSD
jgi:hypothetical protein